MIRLITQNSHDQYRDSKQVDKAVFDVATRSFSIEIQELIVKLLNEANPQIQEAHASIRGQQMLAGQDVLPLIELDESIDPMALDNNAADSTNSLNVEQVPVGSQLYFYDYPPSSNSSEFTSEPLARASRKRQAPQRFMMKIFQNRNPLRTGPKIPFSPLQRMTMKL